MSKRLQLARTSIHNVPKHEHDVARSTNRDFASQQKSRLERPWAHRSTDGPTTTRALISYSLPNGWSCLVSLEAASDDNRDWPTAQTTVQMRSPNMAGQT